MDSLFFVLVKFKVQFHISTRFLNCFIPAEIQMWTNGANFKILINSGPVFFCIFNGFLNEGIKDKLPRPSPAPYQHIFVAVKGTIVRDTINRPRILLNLINS